MSLSGIFSADDADRARQSMAGAGQLARARAAALRVGHELATRRLRARLPFRWEPGVVRRRYQGPSLWERGPAAVHIWLQQPVLLDGGQVLRPAGDWLCLASLDTGTGEVRYECQAAPMWADGTGGPEAYYEQQPTCKKCLKKADQFPAPANG